MTIDGQEIDTTNKFLVGTRGGKVVILNPPKGELSKHDAMVFAAWIATLGDDDGLSFDAAREAIQNT